MNCGLSISGLIAAVLVVLFCQNTHQHDTILSKEEMMRIARENDDKFSQGLLAKDATFIAGIYSDSAQYVQPNRRIICGKDSIRKDWEHFVYLKEQPIDLVLFIHDVRGNSIAAFPVLTGNEVLHEKINSCCSKHNRAYFFLFCFVLWQKRRQWFQQ